MYFKKLFFLLILLPVLVMAKTTSVTEIDTIMLDKLAATVNEEIITYSDIEKAIRIFSIPQPENQSNTDFYKQVLEDLIDYKVVAIEYRNDMVLEDEDYDLIQSSVIEKNGSLERLNAVLRSYGMEWNDFKAFIREKVAYEKVLDKLVKIKVSIPFSDIENYYNTQYLPSQENIGLQPKSLIEMSPEIETYLRKEQTQQELTGWLKQLRASYKIENKLGNEN